jgi:hypothetical protein
MPLPQLDVAALLGKLTDPQLIKYFPACYGAVLFNICDYYLE